MRRRHYYKEIISGLLVALVLVVTAALPGYAEDGTYACGTYGSGNYSQGCTTEATTSTTDSSSTSSHATAPNTGSIAVISSQIAKTWWAWALVAVAGLGLLAWALIAAITRRRK